MELFVIVIFLSFTGAQESQLEGPQNTLSFVGSTVYLRCSPPSRNCSQIDWQKYVKGASPITIFNGDIILNTVDRDRYSVNNNYYYYSRCDLVIRNVQLSDAGRFICSAIISSNKTSKSADLIIRDALEKLLDGPENTLGFVGSTVALNCSTPFRNCNGIDWQKFVPGKTPITVFKGPRTILNTNVSDKNRYSVDNSSGCDLIIKNVQLTDAGRFICSAIVTSNQYTKTAHLIILDGHPKCTINTFEDSIVEGERRQLTCEVTYNGTDEPSMIWKGVDDAPAVVRNGNTVSRSYSVVASAPEVPSFTCVTSLNFAFQTDHNGMPIMGLATNIPNAICSTSALKVIYSVRNVTLSPSLFNYPPGIVINCTAKGRPLPTFKWQDKDNCGIWMDIRNQFGSQFTMTNVSSKRFRCVAANIVRYRTHNATSREIQSDNTEFEDNLSSTRPIVSEDRLGIGIGIGLFVAILLATIAVAILIRLRYLEFHPRPTDKSPGGVAQQENREMIQSSLQQSAMGGSTLGTAAPLVDEQEPAYASLGEDKDVVEYASLAQTEKAMPKKK